MAVAFLTVAIAACSGGGSSTNSAPTESASTPPASTASSSAATGPATAHFALVGTHGAAGAISAPAVQCDEPSLAGPQIRIFATAPGKGTSVMIVMHPGMVAVRYDTGAGTSYRERDFSGTGLSGFDPAHGVQVSSPLSETTVAGGKRGTLGAITSIKGAVDCAGQTHGSSAITVSGTTTLGALSGAQSPVSVECGPTGALLLGIMHAGSTPVLIDLGVNPTAVSVLLVTTGATPVVYQSLGKGLITKTGDKIHVPPINARDSAGKTVHVAGDAVCGA